MDRSSYIQDLKLKVNRWGRELSSLQDDVDRADEGEKEDYTALLRDVYRNYEAIESRIDEIEQMTEESFADEKPMIDECVAEFDVQLKEVRENIQDV